MVEKGSFIELEYTGKLTNDKVFDSSIKEIAEREHVHRHNFEPLFVVVGESQVIKGLDKRLEEAELGKDYTFNIPMEEAYGKKDPRLVRVVSKNVFTKQKLDPYPGMQITAEGMMGLVRSVSGGRVFVDFNHPLAGKDLVFDIKITKIITDDKEKVQKLIKSLLMLDENKYSLVLDRDKLTIKSEIKFPDVMLNAVKERIEKLIPGIKSIEFKEEPKNQSTTTE